MAEQGNDTFPRPCKEMLHILQVAMELGGGVARVAHPLCMRSAAARCERQRWVDNRSR